MSDTPQGPGWYQAVDGKWYPVQPPPAMPTRQPIWPLLLLVGLVAFGVVMYLSR